MGFNNGLALRPFKSAGRSANHSSWWIGLFLIGVCAYDFLPVAASPMSFSSIRVSAQRPGADPL